MKKPTNNLLADALVLATLLFNLSSPAATLTHNYELNGDLADSLGGPSLVEVIDTDRGAPDGSGIRPTGFEFSSGAIPNPASPYQYDFWGHGLSLSGAINSNSYSIEMFFRVDLDRYFMKLIDFYDRGRAAQYVWNGDYAETGFYVTANTPWVPPGEQEGYLSFYGLGAAWQYNDFQSPGEMVHVVVTRTDGFQTQEFVAYLNGEFRMSLDFWGHPSAILNEHSKFSADIAHFFIDDRYNGAEGEGGENGQSEESPNGFVDFIRIYDGPLTAEEVRARYLATVDRTPPTIGPCVSVTANATSPSGAVVAFATPPATDNVAVASVTCLPDSGSTFPIGTTRVTCTATDTSGNSANCEFDVVVLGASEQITPLVSLVVALNLAQGIENSLDAKLQNAQAAIAAASSGDIAAACGQLGAFINEVNAQSGKKITAAQAAQLVQAANQNRATLGCP